MANADWNTSDEAVHACEFLWDIENFSVSIMQNRDFIISPVIASRLVGNSGWCICLLLEGNEDEKYISVFFRRISNDKGPTTLKVRFDISLVDNRGFLCHTKSLTDSFSSGDIRGHVKFVEKKLICGFNSKMLRNDILTLKGRLSRRSFFGVYIEKTMVRTSLKAEKTILLLKINPKAYSTSFDMESDTIRGLKLRCSWDSIASATGKPQLPEIRVEMKHNTSTWTFVSVKIFVLNKTTNHSFETTSSHRYLPGSDDDDWILPSLSDWIDEGHGFDELEVTLEFAVSDGESESFNEKKFSDIHKKLLRALEHHSLHTFASDMKPIVFHDTYPDVYVKMGEEHIPIPAHRVVLSARSPILRKLLMDAKTKWELSLTALKSMVCTAGKHQEISISSKDDHLDKAVQKSGVTVSRSSGTFLVEFPDEVDTRVISKMLSFMYTDTIRCVGYDIAMQLLVAADVYQIKGLKEWCASFLKTCIDVKRAQSIFLAAKSYGCVALENEVRLFIYENRDFMDYHMEEQVLLYTDISDRLI